MGIRIKYEVVNTESNSVVCEGNSEQEAIDKIDAQFEKYKLKDKSYPTLDFTIRKVWTNSKPPAIDLL